MSIIMYAIMVHAFHVDVHIPSLWILLAPPRQSTHIGSIVLVRVDMCRLAVWMCRLRHARLTHSPDIGIGSVVEGCDCA